MTDRRSHPTHPTDPRPADADGERTVAVFLPRRRHPPSEEEQLANAFLRWAWEAGFDDWDDAVRALARTLRGLERTGFIERYTIRRPGHPPRHGVTLTDDGRSLLAALAGESSGGDR